LEKVGLKSFSVEKVVKVVCENFAELGKVRHDIHKKEIDTFEADLNPSQRFMIDEDIYTSIEIAGDYDDSEERVDRVYRNPEIKPADFRKELKIVSVDIEVGEDGSLLCIGIFSKGYKKTFYVSEKELGLKDVISCSSEEDCLEKFKEELIDFDPDIITGWNVIDFDFAYLKDLFDKYGVRFDLGRTNEACRLRIEGNFFKKSSLKIPGRLVMDGLDFVKDPYIRDSPTMKSKNFESFTLEDVSQEMIGKGKLLKGKDRGKDIWEYYKTSPEKLVEYNLLDCQLVYEILEGAKLIDLAVERAELTGMSIDRVGSSIASFDSLYIREARKRGIVSPTARFATKEKGIRGGFVMSSVPGIYENVLVLDFKSLYPSIIKTFNIDRSKWCFL
jgi:DNA polymerase-2